MNRPNTTFPLRIVVRALLLVVLLPFLPLLLSWHWDWWEGWAYAVIGVLAFVVSRGLAARRHPDLIAERIHFKSHENDKRWDRVLVALLAIGLALMLLVAGLDARFGWSPAFNFPTKVLSLVLILVGYVWGTYALLENRFFTAIVRLQIERRHQVVSSGPYRWMRHPGYAGTILASLVAPVFLDSRWAFVPATFATVVLVIRTAWEDRFLQDELPGYADYAKRVRCRLLPGVW